MNNDRQAALQGLLLGWAGELPDRGEWDPSTVKELTEDLITASRKYGSPVTFRMSATLCFAGQNLPYTRDDSVGFWRRIRVVPFLASFEGSPKKVLNLKDTLRKEEVDGIFLWMVEGWKRWKKEGLGMCEAVKEASKRYQEQSLHGTPGEFLNLYCIRQPGEYCHQSDFKKAYQFWAEGIGCRAWNGSTVRAFLEEKGHPIVKKYAPTLKGNIWAGSCYQGMKIDETKIQVMLDGYGKEVVCFVQSVTAGGVTTATPVSPVAIAKPKRDQQPEQPEPIPDEVLEMMRDQQMASWHEMEENDPERQAELASLEAKNGEPVKS